MQSCATISDTFDNFPLCLTSTLRVKDLLILCSQMAFWKVRGLNFLSRKPAARGEEVVLVCVQNIPDYLKQRIFSSISRKRVNERVNSSLLMSSTCSSPRSSAVLQKAVTTRSPERIATFLKPCFFSLDCWLLVPISAKVTWLSSSMENFSSFLLSLPCLPGSSSLPQTLVLSPSKLSF